MFDSLSQWRNNESTLLPVYQIPFFFFFKYDTLLSIVWRHLLIGLGFKPNNCESGKKEIKFTAFIFLLFFLLISNPRAF